MSGIVFTAETQLVHRRYTPIYYQFLCHTTKDVGNVLGCYP